MGAFQDLAGERFGHWLVESRAPGLTKTHGAKWYCVCSCGTRKIVQAHTLKRGTSQSCGCRYRNKSEQRRFLPSGELSARWRFSSYKTGAKQRGLAFDLTWEQFIALIEGACDYCGRQSAHKYTCRGGSNGLVGNGIDRVDNSEGYVPSNCVSCCKTCNSMKNDLTVGQFHEACRRVVARADSMAVKQAAA
jgi:hypothetical protein